MSLVVDASSRSCRSAVGSPQPLPPGAGERPRCGVPGASPGWCWSQYMATGHMFVTATCRRTPFPDCDVDVGPCPLSSDPIGDGQRVRTGVPCPGCLPWGQALGKVLLLVSSRPENDCWQCNGLACVRRHFEGRHNLEEVGVEPFDWCWRPGLRDPCLSSSTTPVLRFVPLLCFWTLRKKGWHGRLHWTRSWTFKIYKRQTISWAPDFLSAVNRMPGYKAKLGRPAFPLSYGCFTEAPAHSLMLLAVTVPLWVRTPQSLPTKICPPLEELNYTSFSA